MKCLLINISKTIYSKKRVALIRISPAYFSTASLNYLLVYVYFDDNDSQVLQKPRQQIQYGMYGNILYKLIRMHLQIAARCVFLANGLQFPKFPQHLNTWTIIFSCVQRNRCSRVVYVQKFKFSIRRSRMQSGAIDLRNQLQDPLSFNFPIGYNTTFQYYSHSCNIIH